MCEKHDNLTETNTNGETVCESCGNTADDCNGANGWDCDWAECTCNLEKEVH